MRPVARRRLGGSVFAVPALIFFAAFWLAPIARLFSVGASGPDGAAEYLAVLTHPNYLRSFLWTVGLSVVVTVVALVFGTITGVFLGHARFRGKSLIVGLITLPIAFPGVVVGFFVILLAGRNGTISHVVQFLGGPPTAFAYNLGGLFLGYLYFSIPRVALTVVAATAKLDGSLFEAARMLGASPAQIARDILVPALSPALTGACAICFATSMGAFGTAFTLATKVTVLPITIYNEFTNYANFSSAAALSIVLGLITWIALVLARAVSEPVTAAGA